MAKDKHAKWRKAMTDNAARRAAAKKGTSIRAEKQRIQSRQAGRAKKTQKQIDKK